MYDKDLVRVTSKIITSPYPSYKTEAFLRYLSSDKADKELLINLISFALELPEPLIIGLSSYGSVTEPIPKILGKLYYYKIILDDTNKTRNYFYSLSREAQLSVYLFVSREFKSLDITSVLDMLPTLHTMAYLLANFIELPESVVDTETSTSFGSLLINKEPVDFPFYLLKIRKWGRRMFLGYLLNEGGNITSNITSRAVRASLSKGKEGDYGVVALIIRNKKGNKRYTVSPLLYGRSEEIYRFIRGKGTKVEPLLNIPKFKDTGFVKFERKNPILVSNKEELIESLKKVKNGFIFSEKGISRVKLTHIKKIYKVVDYILNDYYEPIGLVYLVDGEEKEIYCNVNDDFLENGLKNSYIVVREYYYGDILVTSEVLSQEFGIYYRKCVNCGEIKLISSGELCSVCYSKYLKFAKSHVEDKVETDVFSPKEHFSNARVDKYLVSYSGDKVVFEKNLEGLEGRQFALPFNYFEEWEK